MKVALRKYFYVPYVFIKNARKFLLASVLLYRRLFFVVVVLVVLCIEGRSFNG